VSLDDTDALAIPPDPDGGIIGSRDDLSRWKEHHALDSRLVAFQNVNTLAIPPNP